MQQIDKRLLRLALAIHAELAPQQDNRRTEPPTWSWNQCVDLLKKGVRAEARGWKLAAAELRREAGYTLSNLQAELNTLAARLPQRTPDQTNATAGDIYADLMALVTEFDEVEFDVRGRWISVVTEPIALKGIYLGPFEIRFDVRRASDESPYRVIAKDPHPAESNESVTHPHVMDERLCEGDGKHAIRQSLCSGRLLDFFTLVAIGLRSYNPESPFVSLDIWYGGTCTDCGAAMDEDDACVCRRCEETVCGSCESCCAYCDESCCSQCISCCALCDEICCRACLRPCRDCNCQICPTCLHTVELSLVDAVGKCLAQSVPNYPAGLKVYGEMILELSNRGVRTVKVHDERCMNCHEKRNEASSEEELPATGDTEVQPDVLGEAVVSA